MRRPSIILQKCIAIVLAVAFILPASTVFAPHKEARAQFGGEIVFDPANHIENAASALSQLASSASLASLVSKETIFDALAWFANEVLIKHITRSIINWINSGFDGNPGFVTDFQGFLTDAVDQEIGRFIEGTALGALCSPFELEIRAALAIKYQSFEDQIACRITDIIDNVDNFIAGVPGSFRDGGWRAWYQLSVHDNPYNRYLEASTEGDIRIANRKGEEIELLRWSGGFFSWEDCSSAEDSGGAESCEIVTPGKLIEDQVSSVLTIGHRRIEIADEINEIVGALLAQLATQVFTGGGGLRGVSRSSTSGGTSYLDDLNNANDLPIDVLLGGGGRIGQIGSIGQGVDIENRLRTDIVEILEASRNTEALLNELATTCGASLGAARLAQVTELREETEDALFDIDRNLAILSGLSIRLENAQNIDEVDAINAEFDALVEAGVFHTFEEVVEIRSTKNQTLTQLQQIDAQTQQQIIQCQNFGP